MYSKIAIVVSVVLLIAGSWWWIAEDPPRGLPGAEDATRASGEQHDQQTESKRDPASGKTTPANSSRTRTNPESGALESEAARSGSASTASKTIGALGEREAAERELARRLQALVDAEERGRAVDDSQDVRESEDFRRIKQLLNALGDNPQETPGGDSIEPDASDLNPEEADLNPEEADLNPEEAVRIDLDGDEVISPWELERDRRRRKRAEYHPVNNDLGDGAYPIEREHYRRPEQEFDAVDTNGDRLIDGNEYYGFLTKVDRITLDFDVDGDRSISRAESGLSNGEFEALDFQPDGLLKGGEIEQGVAQGVLD